MYGPNLGGEVDDFLGELDDIKGWCAMMVRCTNLGT